MPIPRELICSLYLLLATALSAVARPHPEIALPEGLKDNDSSLRFIDLNGDGHPDLIFSNAERYGVYLFNPTEKKNLGWMLGWSHQIREGKPGDRDSLPSTVGPDVAFHDGAMWVKGVKAMSYDELARPPAPAPRSPQDSLKAIHVSPGFTVELAAAEPLIQDPIYIDWDARGRLWVVEMADYPFHERDGKVRSGRVKILESTRGDGVYDKVTVFLDHLSYPTGLACWKNGVIIASVPEVFYAEDADGDGKADRRSVLFDGFAKGNPQHLLNGFSWGLDGWYYGGNGDSGGKVRDVSTGKVHDLSGRDFRFNPRTGEFQLQAGRAQYGRWRDDFGNWFANANNVVGWHYFLDDHYLARNPKLAVPTLRHNLNPSGTPIFPASVPMRRLNQPTAINVLTSSCNPIPYRDNLFGPDFATSLFLCEPANNLVHREVLTPDGVSFSSRRAVSETSSEFLASEDNWSRFTQARTGPDGCLYVVDMYRLIIEHPEWIPPQMLGSLDLFAGHDKGRIYRIRPQGSTPRKIPDLSKQTDGELGLALQSPNGWTRDTAQRLLVERGSKWSVTQPAGSPATQVQQLWTMHTLGTLTAATLQAAHLSPHATVREHAVRLCEDRLSEGPLLDAVLKAAEDADLRVRYQAALTLGATQDPRRDAVFSELGKKATGQAPIFIALLTAAPGHAEAKAWQAAFKVTNSPSVKNAAPIITGTVNPERAKIVARYTGVAALTGNSANGHALYLANCAACHKLKGEGNEIGPDLGTIAGKPTEQLLEAIFDPSRAVEQRYLLQTITLKDGRTLAGLVSEQNANAITLKLGAVTEVILREQVAKIETSNKSLMPDGLEAILNPQQTADLLAWVRQK